MSRPTYTLRVREALERRGVTFYSLEQLLSPKRQPPERALSHNTIYRLGQQQPIQIGLDTLAKLQWGVKELTGETIPTAELWEYSE